jgi:hypothetical protein
MILAGGFTSDREHRRSQTETEATNLNDRFPPPARPWLDGPAFYPCSPGGEPNSDDFLYVGAARFGRIDRSSQRSRCARRCRRTEARKSASKPSLMKLPKLLSQG